MNEINQFIEMILDKKGVEIPDAEIRQGLIEDLSVRLANQINRNIVAALSDEDIARIDDAVEAGRMEEVSKIIDASGIDQRAITGRTMVEFGKKYLG